MNSLANKQHSEHQQVPGKEALFQQIQPDRPDHKTNIKKSIKIANTANKRKITDSAGNTRKDDRVESGWRDDGEVECSDDGGGDLDDDEDEKADIEAQNALLLEAGAVIPKANWIPVAAAKEPTIAKVKPDKQDDCVSAMQIKWTPNEAKTKRSEHHAEIETKLIQQGGQVAKKLEAQRGFDQQHQKQLEPPPGLVMAVNASNSHTHHPQQRLLSQPALTAAPVKSTPLTTTDNPISNARTAITNLPPPTNPINTFKPKVTLKAGFDSSSPGAGGIGKPPSPRDYKRDGPIGNQYKFLKYPEADSSSILFHSLQGDLMRKRRQIATSPAINNTALVGLAITSSAADTTVQSETLSPAASSKSAPFSSSVATSNAPNLPPAPTVRMDSNSVTDLSQFYHTPSSLHPSFLETLSDRIYAIFLAPQPDFWKPDRDALSCTTCNVDFDWPFVRRHHCRKCGDLFCASCSQFRAAIRRDGTLITDTGIIAVERVFEFSNLSLAGTAAAGLALLFARRQFRKSFAEREECIPTAGWEVGPINFTNLYYHWIKRVDLYHRHFHNKLGPIFRAATLEGVDEVYIACPQLAKRVFTSSDFTLVPPMKAISEGLLDNSLICLSTGPTWKAHRTAIQPGFGPMHIRSSAVVSMKIAQDLAHKVILPKLKIVKGTQKNGVDVNLWETVNLLMLDIMGLVMFSTNFNAIHLEEQDARDRLFGNTEKEFLDPFITRTLIPKFLWPMFGVGKDSPRILSTRQKYVDFMKTVAKRAESRFNVGNSNESKTAGKDNTTFESTLDMNFMERLLLAGEQGRLTTEEIYSESIIMFLAGQDTTTSLITSMISFLAQNPKVQDRLHDEICSIDLEELQANPTAAFASKLPYLEQVCKETLRMDSAVPATLRHAAQDTELGGCKIAKGTKVYVSLNSVNRDSASYKNPDTFDPDRWAVDESISESANCKMNPNAFIPFGGGSRMCIGRKMSIAEAKAVLCSLVPLFEFEWIDNHDRQEEPVEIVSLVTTFPKNLKIRFVPRSRILGRRDSAAFFS